MNDTGTVGAVAPGELLGPIVGLTFSSGGDILFASCGSSVRAYSVGSGKLLVSRRVFPSGVAVSGLDIGDEGLSEFCIFRRMHRRRVTKRVARFVFCSGKPYESPCKERVRYSSYFGVLREDTLHLACPARPQKRL